jgi:hypothetical protein
MRKSTKILGALGASAVVLSTAGVAYAYWSTSGTGTGSATTDAGAANLTVTHVSAPTNMAPGVPAGSFAVDVTNNAAATAMVNKVVVTISSVTGSNITPTTPCTADDYTLSGTLTNAAGQLANGQTASFTGGSLSFNNSPTANQDGCKGATVHLLYTVS